MRPGLTAGALGPSIVSLNTNKREAAILRCAAIIIFIPPPSPPRPSSHRGTGRLSESLSHLGGSCSGPSVARSLCHEVCVHEACVFYYCRTNYKAVRVRRGLCGLVCPSRTSERGG